MTKTDINDFTCGWYAGLDELVEELNESGYEVLSANSEIIEVEGGENEDGDDIHFVLRLYGTERTIAVDEIETVTL